LSDSSLWPSPQTSLGSIFLGKHQHSTPDCKQANLRSRWGIPELLSIPCFSTALPLLWRIPFGILTSLKQKKGVESLEKIALVMPLSRKIPEPEWLGSGWGWLEVSWAGGRLPPSGRPMVLGTEVKLKWYGTESWASLNKHLLSKYFPSAKYYADYYFKLLSYLWVKLRLSGREAKNSTQDPWVFFPLSFSNKFSIGSQRRKISPGIINPFVSIFNKNN
jgi:hypothetical protein